MVCDLFESILQNYYTGLILIWDLNSEEAKNKCLDIEEKKAENIANNRIKELEQLLEKAQEELRCEREKSALLILSLINFKK